MDFDATTGATGHLPGTSAYRRLIAALFFAGIATFAQLYSPQAVLSQIAGSLRIDAASAALVVSASTIGLAISVIPWSAAADRFGRVRSMTVAIASATVLGLLVPFAPTFALLLSGRVLEGIMLGGVPAVAIAYLTEEVDARHAARAAGTYVAGTTVGGLLGRIVAGPIAAEAGWRAGVLTVAVLCAVASVLFIVLAPPSRRFTRLKPASKHTVSEPGRRERGDGLWARMLLNLRSPRQLALYAQGFLLMGGFVALYNYLGFRLAATPFSLAPSLVSLVFLAYLAGTWSSAAAGVLASRVGRRVVLLVSIGVMVVGVLLTLVDLLPVVLIGLVVATAGFFGAHSIASGWAGSDAPTGKAQAASLYNFFYYLGSSLFGWLGGLFFVSAGWTGTAVMVIALAAIAVMIAASQLRRPAR